MSEIRKEFKELKDSSMKALFRCIVCFEPKPNCFLACHFCGRYLGCYSCIIKIKRCPICRKDFKCEICSVFLPRKPLFIPLIEDQMGIPAVDRAGVIKSAEESAKAAQSEDNDDDDDDFDLLPVLSTDSNES